MPEPADTVERNADALARFFPRLPPLSAADRDRMRSALADATPLTPIEAVRVSHLLRESEAWKNAIRSVACDQVIENV